MTKDSSVKNDNDERRNQAADLKLWENMEEMWLPFSVWPPLEELRESDL